LIRILVAGCALVLPENPFWWFVGCAVRVSESWGFLKREKRRHENSDKKETVENKNKNKNDCVKVKVKEEKGTSHLSPCKSKATFVPF
jgi:hypothetical protein